MEPGYPAAVMELALAEESAAGYASRVAVAAAGALLLLMAVVGLPLVLEMVEDKATVDSLIPDLPTAAAFMLLDHPAVYLVRPSVLPVVTRTGSGEDSLAMTHDAAPDSGRTSRFGIH